MKLISIVIATFNADDTLEKCLSSIYLQKNESVELIVIDGGSTDATLSILDKYSMYIDYYISEPDRGIYDAWNKGISHSNGQWLMFIGADDTLLDDALEGYLKCLKTIGEAQYDYICAKANYFGSNNRFIKVIGIPWSWKSFRRKMDIVHVGSLHNRGLFQDIGQFSLDYKICGDYEVLLRKKDKLKAIYLDKVIVNMQSGGVSFTLDAIIEARKIREKYSDLSLFQNRLIFIVQILLFYRFKIITFLK